MMQPYTYDDKSHLQQAAMGAVDMGMAMREAAVGSFFSCPLCLLVSLSSSFSLTHTFLLSQNLVSLTLLLSFARSLSF
jgi:hypothetical protein